MGINDFLLGLCNDLYARCQRLIKCAETTSPYRELADFGEDTCAKLRELQQHISDLQDSDIIMDPRFGSDVYEEYQDISSEVSLLEQFAIPVLIRYNEIDHIQSRVIAALAQEIGYPVGLIPIAITTSDQYYWAKPELRVVAMPAGEIGGILGWPDLVHEMAHILLESWPDFLRPFDPIVKKYFHRVIQSLGDLNASEIDNKWLIEARIKWGERQAGMWQIEMAANLIATFVLGPSFGWQHMRLSINHAHSPYIPSPGDPPEDHPADQAQLDCISEMLILSGLQDENRELQSQWQKIIEINRIQRPQGYLRYYPPELLNALAKIVFEQCRVRGLMSFTDPRRKGLSTSVVSLVDQAWHKFRRLNLDSKEVKENKLK